MVIDLFISINNNYNVVAFQKKLLNRLCTHRRQEDNLLSTGFIVISVLTGSWKKQSEITRLVVSDFLSVWTHCLNFWLNVSVSHKSTVKLTANFAFAFDWLTQSLSQISLKWWLDVCHSGWGRTLCLYEIVQLRQQQLLERK